MLDWIVNIAKTAAPVLGLIGTGVGLYSALKGMKSRPAQAMAQPQPVQPAQTPQVPKVAGSQDQVEPGEAARRRALMSLLPAQLSGTPISTMLTGPGGVDNSLLSLGKGTLLGGGR